MFAVLTPRVLDRGDLGCSVWPNRLGCGVRGLGLRFWGAPACTLCHGCGLRILDSRRFRV